MPKHDEVTRCTTCTAKYYGHELKGLKFRLFRICPQCKRETCSNCRDKTHGVVWAEYHQWCAHKKDIPA